MPQMMFDRLVCQPANRSLLQETLSVPTAQKSSIWAKNLDANALSRKDLT
jgi:hypothetical protein